MLGAFLGLFKSIAVAFQGDEFGAVDEAVDEGDHTSGVGEDVVPFPERFVGGEDNGAVLISARDDLEEEVGIAVVIGEIAELVDTKDSGLGVAAKAPGKRRIGVLGGEVVEHIGGGGKAGGKAAKDGGVGKVFGGQGFADAVGSKEHGVGGLVEELESEQFIDEGPVDFVGPVPIEVGERFEGTETSIVETAFEGTPGAFVLFDVDEAQ